MVTSQVFLLVRIPRHFPVDMPCDYDAVMPSISPPRRIVSPTPLMWGGVLALLVLACLLSSSFVQTVLSSRLLATNFVSPSTWLRLTGVRPSGTTIPDEAAVNFATVITLVSGLVLLTWGIGAIALIRGTDRGISGCLFTAGIATGGWWCLLDIWEWTWISVSVIGWEGLTVVVTLTPQLWLGFCFAGIITTFLALANSPDIESPRDGIRVTRWVALASLIYVVTYTTMNWRLYFNLLIPHGDSAMYEEHLWNLLHGKGFRSYLDQGLFWGEHIQFVHLFLIPLYVIWPSHLLMELAESTALALGAFPVYWMTRRQTKSGWAGLAAAVAYLLYTPMQFLDIEIDLKTFRPEAFGIPLLLLTLDQLERRNLRGFLTGLLFTLTVKEDYAIIFGPLGLWIVWREWLEYRQRSSTLDPGMVTANQQFNRPWAVTGLAVAFCSVAYLWVATRILMPWFRSGVEIHYAGYFKKFGTTPEQIVVTMLTNPGLLFGELVTPETILYGLAMLAPVAFLPLFSAGRLAVAGPLFGILCLNSLARDPRHHFHAPLVAIVFWSVAGGLPIAQGFLKWIADRRGSSVTPEAIQVMLRTILWSSSFTTGLFVTLGPLGVPFWDSGSPWGWRRLYGQSPRAEKFARIESLVPKTSRVASTDFVHPRYTHHERSYDYSNYSRKVSNYEKRVPDDTDYIVIDTHHPYSTIKRPEEIPEFRDRPDQWELLPDETEGFFIILRRRNFMSH